MSYKPTLLTILCILVGCSTTSGREKPAQFVAGSGNTCLTAFELATLPPTAVAGNIEAVKSLILHYSVCIDDREEALGWMRLGGDLGDIESRKDLIDELQRLKIPAEVAEATALAEQWGLEYFLEGN